MDPDVVFVPGDRSASVEIFHDNRGGLSLDRSVWTGSSWRRRMFPVSKHMQCR